MAASMGAPAFFPLIGIVFIGIAIYNMVNGTTKAGTYQSELNAYEVRRQLLLKRIQQEKNS